MITNPKCFYCGEEDHFVKDCRWKNIPCIIEGCRYKMVLLVSKVERSHGCRFLRCKNQPICSAFMWVDEPPIQHSSYVSQSKASSSSSTSHLQGGSTNNVKVVKEANGVKLSFEGNVDDVVHLMKKTHMY